MAISGLSVPAGNAIFTDAGGVLTPYGRNLLIAIINALNAGDGASLKKALNLSDLSSVIAARANLGLGSAALHPTAFFAQVVNNLSDLANAATARNNLGLGSIAIESIANFLQTADNLSDLANAVTARGNLGLGSIATFPETTVAEYLADIAGRALSTDKAWAAAVTVPLVDANPVTMDFGTFINAQLTGTGAVGVTRTLGAAANAKVGQLGIIEWFPVMGALTLVIPSGSSYVAAGGVATLVLSNTNGARDGIAYNVLNDGQILLVVNKGLSA